MKVKYRCGNCMYVGYTVFDKIEISQDGKNLFCPKCKCLLWVNIRGRSSFYKNKNKKV